MMHWKNDVDEFDGIMSVCDCPLNHGRTCRDTSPGDCQLWEQHVARNADALISLGYKEWRKAHKRGHTVQISQEEQLRQIEDALVDDPRAERSLYGT